MKVIRTLATPNENALKFQMSTQIMGSGSLSFLDNEHASKDNTANELFKLSEITSVFFIKDTVTINKKSDADWNDLIPPIADILEAGSYPKKPIKKEKKQLSLPHGQNFDDLTKIDRMSYVNSILDKSIRPALEDDGGGIEILNIEDNNIYASYEGACGGCSSATSGTLDYIEETLRSKLNENIKVIISA